MILQDMCIHAKRSLFFVFCRILQESCKNFARIPARYLQILQNPRNIKDFFLQECASLARLFLLGVAFNKHFRVIALTIKIHELSKKTGDVGEKLSSGHKEKEIKKCSGEFFKMFIILLSKSIPLRGGTW